MGAIGGGGTLVLNPHVIERLEITQSEIEKVAAVAGRELDRRESLYRQGRPPLPLAGKTVLLVDDGIATGATAEAAIRVLREKKVASIVLCAGVAAKSTAERLSREADDVVCVLESEDLSSIGEWYRDFRQTTDEEVQRLLREAEMAGELQSLSLREEKRENDAEHYQS
jgi:predicted phosphoribosyltransferase